MLHANIPLEAAIPAVQLFAQRYLLNLEEPNKYTEHECRTMEMDEELSHLGSKSKSLSLSRELD